MNQGAPTGKAKLQDETVGFQLMGSSFKMKEGLPPEKRRRDAGVTEDHSSPALM
jgi:hypothetical protein